MSDEMPRWALHAAEGSPRPSWWTRDAVRLCGHPAERRRLAAGAVGGDLGIPGLAGADDGMELAQDRAGQDGLGLGGLELVDLARGQVPVPGGIDRVVLHRAPDCPPGRGPQLRSAGAGSRARPAKVPDMR